MTVPGQRYPGPIDTDLANIPAAVTVRRQWVLWQGRPQAGHPDKLDKVPMNPTTLTPASTTDALTWGTFAQCCAAVETALEGWELADPATYCGGGIGYVFAPDDPYTGIDLDHCVDEVTGVIADWAQAYVDTLASYTEITPSQQGLHILVEGDLPPGGRRKDGVEMYEQGRFFTVTGWHLAETPPTIEARQIPLTNAWLLLFGPQVGDTVRTVNEKAEFTTPDLLTIKTIEPSPDTRLYATFHEIVGGWPLHQCERERATPPTAPTPTAPDAAILAKAFSAANAPKFQALWTGDWQRLAYASQSQADMALCSLLRFWTQDPAQLDRLMRQSGLMRTKWDEQRGAQTYGARTIAAALSAPHEHYTPPPTFLVSAHTPAAAVNGHGSHGGAGGQELRPVIRIGPDITRMVDEGQTALLALAHGPVLFQRARRLVMIAHGVPPPPYLHRSADAPVICEAQAAILDELATQAARWEKYDKRAKQGEKWVEVTPPSRFVQTLQARPGWPFPLLEGLIHSPTLRPDGSILAHPGYDASTGLYLDCHGTTFPSLPASPTVDEARRALGQLVEVFADFPFAVRASSAGTQNPSLSATLAAVLTLVGRPAIAGSVPLFGVTATAAGSGKGKLVDAICRIGTGRYAPKMGQTLDDNEELKRLLALALEGASVCCIDNVTHPLGNQYLDMALTAQAITGRILGQTQTAEAPWNVVLFATGNNLSYRGDMTRRVVPIALDPQMEKPEERAGFRHPQLEAWVQQERPHLVTSALTILRAYFVAGCPAQGLTPYGSFEAWSDLIRNAVVWLGEPDPCEGRQDLAAHTDEGYERLASLLTAWEACYPPKPNGTLQAKTLKEVKQETALYAANKAQVPTTWDHLRDALAEFDKRYDGKNLNTHLIGNALRTIEGRVIDQKRLTRCGIARKQSLWRVETV